MGEHEAESVDGALTKALHAERTKDHTLHVDCWACEAARSKTVAGLIKRLREAEAAASHMHAVLVRAVPDDDAQLALWRDHWRDQLETRTTPTPTEPPSGGDGGE